MLMSKYDLTCIETDINILLRHMYNIPLLKTQDFEMCVSPLRETVPNKRAFCSWWFYYVATEQFPT